MDRRHAGLAVLVLAGGLLSAVVKAQVFDYLCEGPVRTDNVFEPHGVTTAHQRFRVTASVTAGYVKRDPALAAGCFAGRTEVCACDPPSPDLITCRSLGFTRDGTEVSMDFTLQPGDRALQLTGRQFNARSGTLIETSGRLACTLSPASAAPVR